MHGRRNSTYYTADAFCPKVLLKVMHASMNILVFIDWFSLLSCFITLMFIWSLTLSHFLQAETQHLADQASSVGRECSRLERDLEEGSRRLAMAHNEIRRLTDELESAHLTQRAYGERDKSATSKQTMTFSKRFLMVIMQ